MAGALAKTVAVLEAQLLSLQETNSEDITEGQIKKSRAIGETAARITDIQRLALDAARLDLEYGEGRIDTHLINVNTLRLDK